MLRIFEFDKNNINNGSKMFIYFTGEQDFRSFLDMLWKPRKTSLDYYRIRNMMYGNKECISGLEHIVCLLIGRYHKIEVYQEKYLFCTYLYLDEFPDLFAAFFDMAGAQCISDGVPVGLEFCKERCTDLGGPDSY